MVAGVYDIICEQGASFSRILEWLDENELPINLTGYTARMQVRPSVQSSTVWVTLTTDNGGIVITPSTGRIQLVMSATQTNALPSGRAVYDLELAAGLYVTRLVGGTFTVTPQVTRT